MTYKEYVKLQLERAKNQDPYFDPEGNSTTAICNRSFLAQLRKSLAHMKYVYTDLSGNLAYLLIGAVSLIWLITFPISLPITALFHVEHMRRKAKKEMKADYLEEFRHVR